MSDAYLAFNLRVEHLLWTLRSRAFERKQVVLRSGSCSARKTEPFALKIMSNGHNLPQFPSTPKMLQKLKLKPKQGRICTLGLSVRQEWLSQIDATLVHLLAQRILIIGASDRAQKLHFAGANSVPNGHDSVASTPPTTELAQRSVSVSHLWGIPSVL